MMHGQLSNCRVRRRCIGIWLLALALSGVPMLSAGSDWGQAAPWLEPWLAGRAPQPAGLTMAAPAWVEDGAFVPIDISLQGATAPVSLRLLRSAEDEPRIADIQLNSWAEPLRLSTRVRLSRTQKLLLLARDANGKLWLAAQAVEVLGSSCLDPQPRAEPRNTGQIQGWLAGEAELELRTLLQHPMQTGLRPDQDGGLIPRHLPQSFTLSTAKAVLMQVEPFDGLSVNPYWRLLLPLAQRPLRLHWVDGDGREYRLELP
ncbi:thiosulfate oxidation carrier protein SoxY [Pseudomonas sp. 5P_3.1_Bac2]|uniref:thiosulfate oxidation carrier protein SoxY n=1 Tax=Pseudomonas sp. 5P_3.1_Bac2 TaxID=2971617 RepID=UPI0021C5CEF6|nr:thiosulfate oxidation carrier protein SoxY [Pseudomonas sp. 5P_3.1_Bac2]MCU1717404.1 thiosulfate oxidation carrier complex protein SoxZ [Pseudomonas sp. 5P_3.1_Bac2]